MDNNVLKPVAPITTNHVLWNIIVSALTSKNRKMMYLVYRALQAAQLSVEDAAQDIYVWIHTNQNRKNPLFIQNQFLSKSFLDEDEREIFSRYVRTSIKSWLRDQAKKKKISHVPFGPEHEGGYTVDSDYNILVEQLGLTESELVIIAWYNGDITIEIAMRELGCKSRATIYNQLRAMRKKYGPALGF